MSWHEMSLSLCLALGAFGSFGVAHETRIRESAPFLYLLSAMFASAFWGYLYGVFDAAHHHWINCWAGISLFVYAFDVRRYWQVRDEHGPTRHTRQRE